MGQFKRELQTWWQVSVRLSEFTIYFNCTSVG